MRQILVVCHVTLFVPSFFPCCAVYFKTLYISKTLMNLAYRTIYKYKKDSKLIKSPLPSLVYVASDDEARSNRAFPVPMMLRHSSSGIPLIIERGALEDGHISLFDMPFAFSYPDYVVYITIGVFSFFCPFFTFQVQKQKN